MWKGIDLDPPGRGRDELALSMVLHLSSVTIPNIDRRPS
jgi:hypothetical protein